MFSSAAPGVRGYITGCAVVPALAPNSLLCADGAVKNLLTQRPVLTATGFVSGKGQFSTAHRIDTPQPITKKFVTGHCIGDPNSCAKLGAHPSTRGGGFWAHG